MFPKIVRKFSESGESKIVSMPSILYAIMQAFKLKTYMQGMPSLPIG